VVAGMEVGLEAEATVEVTVAEAMVAVATEAEMAEGVKEGGGGGMSGGCGGCVGSADVSRRNGCRARSLYGMRSRSRPCTRGRDRDRDLWQSG
jgi:hypothetical protein